MKFFCLLNVFSCLIYVLLFLSVTEAEETKVRVQVVKNSSTGNFKSCRKLVTGPGFNEHPKYPGCTGFIGWESVTRLSSGEMLCTFSAGYWHVSFPTPIDVKPDLLKRFQKSGFPLKPFAPTGGRALICRSKDNGKTWTQPSTLVDTPWDDRHPVIVELKDGTLLCVFFVIDNWYGYQAPPKGRNKNSRVCSIRSTDAGKTWSKPVFMPSPFQYYDRMCGKPVILDSGSIILPTYGMDQWQKTFEELGVYRSDDSGKNWKFVSRLKSPKERLDEPAFCLTQNKTIVMISRMDGEVAFSTDEAKTWTVPQSIGIRMVAPCLLTLKNGTVVCIYGGMTKNSVELIFSDDGGQTWIAPGIDHGFMIDNSVYKYAIGCEMQDGSIYLVYYDPKGNQTKTAIWSIRLKIRKDRKGIDILPVDP